MRVCRNHHSCSLCSTQNLQMEKRLPGHAAAFVLVNNPTWPPARSGSGEHRSDSKQSSVQLGAAGMCVRPTEEHSRHTQMEACQSSYLNPQPVPPRTIAASRIAPATEPIMILVPLGPVGSEGVGQWGKKSQRKKHQHANVLVWKTCGAFVYCHRCRQVDKNSLAIVFHQNSAVNSSYGSSFSVTCHYYVVICINPSIMFYLLCIPIVQICSK